MLILASNSPRRRQLLALGGWDFSVLPAQVDERVLAGEAPDDYVRRLAESKARAVVEQYGKAASDEGRYSPPSFPPDALVVAADTAVVDWPATSEESESSQQAGVARARILGKPADAAEAESMLRSLRGRAHQVMTGLAIARDARLILHPAEAGLENSQNVTSAVVVTDVWMRNYSDAEMLAYIASGDPLDKAGAYAIQHAEFNPVQSVAGCYANVMGLPLCRLAEMLAGLGTPPPVDFPGFENQRLENPLSGPSGLAARCQAALDIPCPFYYLPPAPP